MVKTFRIGLTISMAEYKPPITSLILSTFLMTSWSIKFSKLLLIRVSSQSSPRFRRIFRAIGSSMLTLPSRSRV